MENWKLAVELMLLALSSFTSHASFDPYWLNIDSGGTHPYGDPVTNAPWYPDGAFIQSGQKEETKDGRNFQYPLNTLLSFPTGTNNCYYLPLIMKGKYIIRAGFYYGNYDGLSKPPTFALEIDGNISVTVNTSVSNDPIFHEVMFVNQKERITVCLIRTQTGNTPFINSLEVAFVADDVYKFMSNDTVLYLERRINYGANSSEKNRFPRFEEEYNRIWTPEELPGYPSRSLDSSEPHTAENSPPYEVLKSASEAENPSDSIFLPTTLYQQTQLPTYFVFYFLETENWYPNETRKVAIYIDGRQKNVTNVTYDCRVVSVYPVNITGTANVTISPAEGTTRPPLISAMEVFSEIRRSAPPVEVSKADCVMCFSSMFLILVWIFSFNTLYGFF